MANSEEQKKNIPKVSEWESTLALLREGYDFVGNRCRKLSSDLFEARILFEPTICLTGLAWAHIFYRDEYFIRRGAAPQRLQKTLFGQQGVQGLDDKAHRHRKALFMSLMNPSSLDKLIARTRSAWLAAIPEWQSSGHEVVLKEASSHILCESVCDWAGVPVSREELPQLTKDLLQLVESAGKAGPGHWQGRFVRKRLERWAAGLIAQVRSGELVTEENTALITIAGHQQLDGSLLPTDIAAVELLNVLRPTVAVTYYILLVAVALQEHPAEARQLAGDDVAIYNFVQEVRRYYPFFPATMARVRKTFSYEGYEFPEGRRVLLDLYGSNHDKLSWDSPQLFRPQRFNNAQSTDSYRFIPQGGGEADIHHRCAGEAVTIRLMALAVEILVQQISYRYVGPKLELPRNKMPTEPPGGFPISDIRLQTKISEQ